MVHAKLAEEYGTKQGSAGAALATLAVAIFAAKALHSGARDEGLREEFQDRDALERELRARQMSQANGQLQGKMASARDAAVADDLGRLLAKEAFAGALLGAGMKALGGAAGGVGKALSTGLTGTARLQNAGEAAGFARALRPGMAQRAGGTLSGIGSKLQGAGQALATKAPAVATPTSKPLIGMGTKAKLLGGAVAAGGLYAAYKGMQGVKDYMSQPSGTASFGGPTPGVMHNVNQWGYPQQ
jgi:hypothetical protein